MLEAVIRIGEVIVHHRAEHANLDGLLPIIDGASLELIIRRISRSIAFDESIRRPFGKLGIEHGHIAVKVQLAPWAWVAAVNCGENVEFDCGFKPEITRVTGIEKSVADFGNQIVNVVPETAHVEIQVRQQFYA